MVKIHTKMYLIKKFVFLIEYVLCKLKIKNFCIEPLSFLLRLHNIGKIKLWLSCETKTIIWCNPAEFR